jgi:deoxycytidylate deaminase
MCPLLTNAERRNLDRAAVAACMSTERFKHGAVLAVGKRVLAVGVNTFRCNPQSASDPKREASFHAEVAVLRQLGYAVPSRAVLYVARVNKAGDTLLSAPCPNCQQEINRTGIRTVVYTTGDGYGVRVKED